VLSTIVLCEAHCDRRARHLIDPSEALVRTLASLVRANVEGLLADVLIAGPEGRGLAIIADHAGCNLIEAESEPEWLRRAVEAARGPDLLLLRSGHAPEPGFIEEAGDLLAGRGRAAARRAVRLHRVPENLVERLFPRLAPLAGLIAPRDVCLDAPHGKFARLVRHVGTTEVLRSCARRVG
jgi:hypothetical protein